MPLLELKNVAGVSLTLEEGELLAIVNGARVVRTVAGLEPTHGEVLLDGERLYRRTPERMARRGVVYLAARGGVFASLSVLENLRLGAWTHRGLSSRDLARAFELFPSLYDVRVAKARSLPARDQRLLALARAAVAKPRVLLAHEPSLGLPPEQVREMFDVLQTINARGAAVVVADQHERLARARASRAIEL